MGDFEKNARIVRQRKQQMASARSEEAKEDLSTKIDISIRTTMVGSLKAIEDNFGHLWGLDEDRPSELQKANAKVWEQLRKQILDLGSSAGEKASYHLNRFDVQYKENDKKYNMKFRSGV